MQGITFGMYQCSQTCLWALMASGRGPRPSGPPHSNHRLVFNLDRFITSSIASCAKFGSVLSAPPVWPHTPLAEFNGNVAGPRLIWPINYE